jgi:hypothetical protein
VVVVDEENLTAGVAMNRGWIEASFRDFLGYLGSECERKNTRRSGKHHILLTSNHVSHRRRLPVLTKINMPFLMAGSSTQCNKGTLWPSSENQATGGGQNAASPISRKWKFPYFIAGINIKSSDEAYNSSLIRCDATVPTVPN